MQPRTEPKQELIQDLVTQLIVYLDLASRYAVFAGDLSKLDPQILQSLTKEWCRVIDLKNSLKPSLDLEQLKLILDNYISKDQAKLGPFETAFPKWISPAIADALLLLTINDAHEFKSMLNVIEYIDKPKLSSETKSERKNAILRFFKPMDEITKILSTQLKVSNEEKPRTSPPT